MSGEPLLARDAEPSEEARAATATAIAQDFAALLEESFTRNEALEGTVIKGKVVAIEKDMAIIDVGLKTEGRVALKEFTGPGRDEELKVGDEVEVYVDRIENALGEAVISRDKARREESWVKLEKAFEANERVTGTGWPLKSIRDERLRECVDVIRRLLHGEEVSHDGHVTVDRAQLWTLADPVPHLRVLETERALEAVRGRSEL